MNEALGSLLHLRDLRHHGPNGAVLEIPRYSETGGRLLFYHQLKRTPAPEQY